MEIEKKIKKKNIVSSSGYSIIILNTKGLGYLWLWIFIFIAIIPIHYVDSIDFLFSLKYYVISTV